MSYLQHKQKLNLFFTIFILNLSNDLFTTNITFLLFLTNLLSAFNRYASYGIIYNC